MFSVRLRKVSGAIATLPRIMRSAELRIGAAENLRQSSELTSCDIMVNSPTSWVNLALGKQSSDSVIGPLATARNVRGVQVVRLVCKKSSTSIVCKYF